MKYFAMNRFAVADADVPAFEDLWLNRESKLHEHEGFVSFSMLKGPSTDGVTLYVSHSVWADEAAFRAWTTSQSFRASHAGAGDRQLPYEGPPTFEGFHAIQHLEA